MNKAKRMLIYRNNLLKKEYKKDYFKTLKEIKHNNECIRLTWRRKNKFGQYEYIGLNNENLLLYAKVESLKRDMKRELNLSWFFKKEVKEVKELWEMIDENRLEHIIQQEREVQYTNPYEDYDWKEK